MEALVSTSPIKRLLIANRGEIAVRIARTAHRLGIGTVGIYADADAHALHLDSMDSAVSVSSYLEMNEVLAAASAEGCDAVHPGYGFLAENAAFAQAVNDAGLNWVGPTSNQIALLGDKVAAKRVAIEAGVPTTEIIAASPGSVPSDVSFPALVKAAAGGGGRGMRVVRSAADLSDAIDAAAREAEGAFGDGRVFIEPFIEHGRHVEVQIMGDRHGNVIHLGERECSIQRRNQKVVEEAPSAGIDDETRQQLLDGALALAQHVGYENAGTVEYLVGEDGTITFLEVNTRLQVEHPVTEAVTGFDLVEMQLNVAAGQPLVVTQDDVVISGHAIEVRVVAEDPSAGWLPSTGEVIAFDLDDPRIRVDSGFAAGSVVSADYDSLLAKVISHAPTRTQAAAVLEGALRSSQIAGVRTNLDSLTAIAGHEAFLNAATPTSFLNDHPEVLSGGGPTDDDRLALALAAMFALELDDRTNARVLGFAPSGWRNLRTQGQRLRLLDLGATGASAAGEGTTGESAELALELAMTGADRAQVHVGPFPEPTADGTLSPDERRVSTVRLLRRSTTEQVIEVDGRRTAVSVARHGDVVTTRSAGGAVAWQAIPRFVDHEASAGGGGPICPLPGTVIAVHVSEGDSVAEGALLMVVEAMKMEHSITAAADSVVSEVRFAVGDRVDSGDLLVALDEAGSESAASEGSDSAAGAKA